MFIVNSYSQAILFCVITMLCWGSWANTQKLAGRSWRDALTDRTLGADSGALPLSEILAVLPVALLVG